MRPLAQRKRAVTETLQANGENAQPRPSETWEIPQKEEPLVRLSFSTRGSCRKGQKTNETHGEKIPYCRGYALNRNYR
jgi:hypothetical protein